jgi:hypothetical protein
VKKLIVVLLLGFVFGLGCSSNTVFVRALQAPKWPVEGNQSIAVIAVLEGKHGREAQLTRDLTAIVASMLKKSAYYTLVRSLELPVGEFEAGASGELIPLKKTIVKLTGDLDVELLLFIEVMHSDMRTRIEGHAGYSVGVGTYRRHSAFGTSFGSGTTYWTVRAQMLAALCLGHSGEKPILAKTVQGHSFDRSFSDILPSESDIFRQLLGRASMRAVACVDVHFNLSPRRLRSDGSQLIREGTHHALAGTRQGWDKAEHLWLKAFDLNPKSPAANYNLGVASEIREEYGNAVSYYQDARNLTGLNEAFEREIREASHSAEVLAVFGPPAKQGGNSQPAPPQEPPQEKENPSQEEPKEPSDK